MTTVAIGVTALVLPAVDAAISASPLSDLHLRQVQSTRLPSTRIS